MALNQRVEAACERLGAQRSSYMNSGRKSIEGAIGLELVKYPESFLRQRQREEFYVPSLRCRIVESWYRHCMVLSLRFSNRPHLSGESNRRRSTGTPHRSC